MAMKKFYVGVKAVIKEERGVLLVQSKKGYWDIPGGRIDASESFEETLRRELAEEVIGAELTGVGTLISASRMPFDVAEETGLVLLLFMVTATVPKDIILCDEMDDHVWVRSEADIPVTGVKDEIKNAILQALE